MNVNETNRLARARAWVRLTWRLESEARVEPTIRGSVCPAASQTKAVATRSLCGASVVSMVTASLAQLRTRFAHGGRFKRISFSLFFFFFQAQSDRLQQEAQIFRGLRPTRFLPISSPHLRRCDRVGCLWKKKKKEKIYKVLRMPRKRFTYHLMLQNEFPRLLFSRKTFCESGCNKTMSHINLEPSDWTGRWIWGPP